MLPAVSRRERRKEKGAPVAGPVDDRREICRPGRGSAVKPHPVSVGDGRYWSSSSGSWNEVILMVTLSG